MRKAMLLLLIVLVLLSLKVVFVQIEKRKSLIKWNVSLQKVKKKAEKIKIGMTVEEVGKIFPTSADGVGGLCVGDLLGLGLSAEHTGHWETCSVEYWDEKAEIRILYDKNGSVIGLPVVYKRPDMVW